MMVVLAASNKDENIVWKSYHEKSFDTVHTEQE